ncbi:MAG TPA: hypothetical protein VD962_09840 [Rubricoccaceae bacterium]|nr:hypothetical protein [Rubricoccaceae bacterium]
MPLPLEITAPVSEDGRLPDGYRRQLASTLALYRGREVRIQVSGPKRTTAANSYYWGVVIKEIRAAMAEAGKAVPAWAIHEHFKGKYLDVQPEEAEVDGHHYTREPSTASLDSTTFFDYVEAIRNDELVLGLGCVIPDPDPSYRSYKIAEP